MMATSNIQPAMVGEYGREMERGVSDPSREGLLGRNFCSRVRVQWTSCAGEMIMIEKNCLNRKLGLRGVRTLKSV